MTTLRAFWTELCRRLEEDRRDSSTRLALMYARSARRHAVKLGDPMTATNMDLLLVQYDR